MISLAFCQKFCIKWIIATEYFQTLCDFKTLALMTDFSWLSVNYHNFLRKILESILHDLEFRISFFFRQMATNVTETSVAWYLTLDEGERNYFRPQIICVKMNIKVQARIWIWFTDYTFCADNCYTYERAKQTKTKVFTYLRHTYNRFYSSTGKEKNEKEGIHFYRPVESMY